MIIKTDFITNSSSASFILTLKALKNNETVDSFRLKLNRYLESYMEETEYSDDGPDHLKFWDASNVNSGKYGTHEFIITEFTSMYNGRDDIPRYMRAMLVESFLEGFLEYGFEVVRFEIDHSDSGR